MSMNDHYLKLDLYSLLKNSRSIVVLERITAFIYLFYTYKKKDVR
jgi:hypothetical protein